MSEEVGPKQQQNKKYGLIIPNKSNTTAKKPISRLKPCIFNDEDDNLEAEDDNGELQAYKPKVNTNETRIKKQTQINIEKALEQDPNIFEYDQIYDKLEETKQKVDPKYQKEQQSREPKYMAGLMKSAALRQLEHEKRQDRKIQKERELEGDLFGDKEAFVTETYRKRMEERQRLEEEEKKQDELEAHMDVTKLKDLRGFYDSMLKLKTGELVIEEESEKQKRLEREKMEKELENAKFVKKSMTSTTTTFRRRKEEEDESSESEVGEDAKPIQTEGLDKDEELSHDEEDDSKNIESGESAVKEPDFKKPKLEEEVAKIEEKVKIETKEERWSRLFTKRTVGKKFDEELSDYFKRKMSFLAMKSYVERE